MHIVNPDLYLTLQVRNEMVTTRWKLHRAVMEFENIVGRQRQRVAVQDRRAALSAFMSDLSKQREAASSKEYGIISCIVADDGRHLQRDVGHAAGPDDHYIAMLSQLLAKCAAVDLKLQSLGSLGPSPNIAPVVPAPKPAAKKTGHLGLLAHFAKVSKHERVVMDMHASPNLQRFPGLHALTGLVQPQHGHMMWLLGQVAFNAMGSPTLAPSVQAFGIKDWPDGIQNFVTLLAQYIRHREIQSTASSRDRSIALRYPTVWRNWTVPGLHHILLCAKALQRYHMVTQSFMRRLAVEAKVADARYLRESSSFSSWLRSWLPRYASPLTSGHADAQDEVLWVTTAESVEHMAEICTLYRARVEQAAAYTARRRVLTQLPVGMFLRLFPTAVAKKVLQGVVARISPSLNAAQNVVGWDTRTLVAASKAVDAATAISATFETIECNSLSSFLQRRAKVSAEVRNPYVLHMGGVLYQSRRSLLHKERSWGQCWRRQSPA